MAREEQETKMANREATRVRPARIKWWSVRKRFEGYIFLLPNIVGFLTFTAFPIFAAFAQSFYDWDLITTPHFVGFKNYLKLIFDDRLFGRVLWNTTLYTLGTVPLRVVLSLLLAIALNQKIRGITVYRTAYFMPVVSSSVAVALVWTWIFNGNFGILNSFLWAIGFNNPPDWLNSTRWALPAIMIGNLWKNVGFTMVIYLAGLQAIPKQLYEAAEIDGASWWVKFRHITVPMVSPTTFFVLVMSIIWSFQVFEEAYIMTEGGPANATNTVVYYIYKNAFQWFKMGKAAAVAWLLFAILFIFTLLQAWYQRRWVHYEA